MKKDIEQVQTGAVVTLEKELHPIYAPIGSEAIVTFTFADVENDGFCVGISNGEVYQITINDVSLKSTEYKIAIHKGSAVRFREGRSSLLKNPSFNGLYEVMNTHTELEREWNNELEDARENFRDEINPADKFVKIGVDTHCDAHYDTVIVPESYLEVVTIISATDFQKMQELLTRNEVIKKFISSGNFKIKETEEFSELLAAIVQ